MGDFTFDAYTAKQPNMVRVQGQKYPTEFEINSCLAKLYLYTDDTTIINSFSSICRFHGDVKNLVSINTGLLKKIKSDLAGKESEIPPYDYILVRRDTSYNPQ